MGRHSRRGPAPKGNAADIAARRAQNAESAASAENAENAESAANPDRAVRAERRVPPPVRGVPRLPDGTPAHGVPRLPDGTSAHGVPGFAGGPRARDVTRFPDGTPAQGVPRLPDGTPAHGMPRFPDGTPAHGVPRFPDGTPAHGVPRLREGGPVRGGHPEQRERGGGWGEFADRARAAEGPGVVLPRQRQAGPGGGPRQDYLDAFGDARGSGADLEDVDVFAARARGPRRIDEMPADAPDAPDAPKAPGEANEGDGGDVPPPVALPAQRSGGKGRAFTGVAAAAVTTVLAVIVAGQVTGSRDGGATRSRSATDQAGDARAPGESTPSPSASAATLTYEQAMDRTYPLSAKLKASGRFDAVPGFDKAPGGGRKYTYRVDIEQGLGLDGALFAEAVQKTLNDKRSWAHGGARTFERISSGKPDFVITLASPGTTAAWCAKSGLDTTEDNVSCDSASTERVMINAYRWAQGSVTYGDKIHPYRQMLINHEVGHRLGYGHVTCQKSGELAPVMQQQTKFLDHDGIHCLPNPWPYPGS
ncbi:DUF3152 domain-containing protein [Streptomyces sp. MMG1121]|uniref:DUF3152 domain-containing protein n=1 Tax=Streptomyces sp. MMG1121 TaxID=1415544 RepID=UPI0006B030DC|nr:DUF3152 domain-containing protein [Streptomyces sp. MMG1121]